MKKMLRLITGIGLGLLSSCAHQKNLESTLTLKNTNQVQASIESPKINDKYASSKTLGHAVLSMEQYNGSNMEDFNNLDGIVNASIKRISPKLKKVGKLSNYSSLEAENILNTIDETLYEKGFTSSEDQDFLNKGLRERKLDCDLYTDIYMSIADLTDLPLNVAYIKSKNSKIEHVFLRFMIKEGYLNWEAKQGMITSDGQYTNQVEYANNFYPIKELTREEYINLLANNILPLSFQRRSEDGKYAVSSNKELEEHKKTMSNIVTEYLNGRREKESK